MTSWLFRLSILFALHQPIRQLAKLSLLRHTHWSPTSLSLNPKPLLRMPQTRSQTKKAKFIYRGPYLIRLTRKSTIKCVKARFPPKPAAGSATLQCQQHSLQPIILIEEHSKTSFGRGENLCCTIREAQLQDSQGDHADGESRIFAPCILCQRCCWSKDHLPVKIGHEHEGELRTDETPD